MLDVIVAELRFECSAIVCDADGGENQRQLMAK
jgi:hypothetical protein